MSYAAPFTPNIKPKTLLLAVQSPYNPIKNFSGYVEEFLNLARTAGVAADYTIIQTLRSVDPAYFLTKGKLQDIVAYCKEHGIEELIFSDPLSPQQERNLSKLLHVRVFDRTALILEIFMQGAESAEGKLQVELARLRHKKSRLAGRGVHLSQQSGRIGTKGPGETLKEKEMQHLEHLMLKIKRDLTRLSQVRHTQRKQRLSSHLPLFCLIGYTNAGKSTLLNQLTKSTVLAEDKLFATLDTTTREWFYENKKQALLSDTVGFIQQLPHALIQAFKSTLDELRYADLLIHVIDASDPNWQDHIEVVHTVLEELELKNKPQLYVFNKIDKVANIDLTESAFHVYQPYIMTDGTSSDGVESLRRALATFAVSGQTKNAA